MFSNFLTAMGINMVYTIISEYSVFIVNSLTIAGVVSGLFSIAALVMRPFAGRMTDLFNKKYLCISANILTAIAVMGYSFSQSIELLVFFRIFHGILFAVGSTANIALATRYIPKDRIGEGIGYFGLGQIIASVIGPALGIYIVREFGFNSLFVTIALLSIMGVITLTALKYDKEPASKENTKQGKLTIHSLIVKEVIILAVIGGMFSLANGIVSSFMILLAEERHILGIGLFFSIGSIVIFLLRFGAGWVADKLSLRIIVNMSLLVTAISMLFIGFANTLILLLLASVLKSIGQGLGQLSLQAESIKRVSEHRVGVATSTFFIGADLGQGVGPIIGGILSDHYDYSTMFYTLALLMVASMLIFNRYEKLQKKQIESV